MFARQNRSETYSHSHNEWNHTIREEMLGVEKEELVGRHIFEFVTPQYIGKLEENKNKRMKGDMSYNLYEVEILSPFGKNISLKVNSMPVVKEKHRLSRDRKKPCRV